VRRLLAVVSIVIGTAIVGFDPDRLDGTLFALSRNHGIHLHDLIGTALIALGTFTLWRSRGSD